MHTRPHNAWNMHTRPHNTQPRATNPPPETQERHRPSTAPPTTCKAHSAGKNHPNPCTPGLTTPNPGRLTHPRRHKSGTDPAQRPHHLQGPLCREKPPQPMHIRPHNAWTMHTRPRNTPNRAHPLHPGSAILPTLTRRKHRGNHSCLGLRGIDTSPKPGEKRQRCRPTHGSTSGR